MQISAVPIHYIFYQLKVHIVMILLKILYILKCVCFILKYVFFLRAATFFLTLFEGFHLKISEKLRKYIWFALTPVPNVHTYRSMRDNVDTDYLCCTADKYIIPLYSVHGSLMG